MNIIKKDQLEGRQQNNAPRKRFLLQKTIYKNAKGGEIYPPPIFIMKSLLFMFVTIY